MPRRRALLLGLLAATLLGACRGAALEPAGSPPPSRPSWRHSGPRLPAVAGGDLAARGWTKVDGLLWVEAEHAEPLRRGLVFDGRGYVPADRALAPGTAPERGFLLRTDHVALRTNLSWAEAARVARVAEDHVVRLAGLYGDALDLRLPDAPLAVVASARRTEFEERLARVAPDPVSWGAFYDGGSGVVHVCAEPAPRAPLPLEADLKHEMTHQVLDLSTPPAGRARIFDGLYLCLWEGIALHAETLGEPPGTGAAAVRRERFLRRLAEGDATSLATLFALPQRAFEGRHYDQTASLATWLLEAAGPEARAATLATLADLLRGRASPGDLERRLGLPATEVEARWRRSLAP